MSIYIPGSGISISNDQYVTPTGTYEGVILRSIPNGLLRLSSSALCYVSGSGPNIFGHALFLIAPGIGYVHAVEPGTHPVRFLPHDEYQRYMQESGKTSKKMLFVELPNKPRTATYIEQCLLIGYNWTPRHNCLTFCDAILKAAESATELDSCMLPSTATKQVGAVTRPAHMHPWDAIGNDDL